MLVTCPYCQAENEITSDRIAGKMLAVCSACVKDFAVFWKVVVSINVFPLGEAVTSLPREKVDIEPVSGDLVNTELEKDSSQLAVGTIKWKIAQVLERGSYTTDEIRLEAESLRKLPTLSTHLSQLRREFHIIDRDGEGRWFLKERLS